MDNNSLIFDISTNSNIEYLMNLIVSHKFHLALAHHPLKTLSQAKEFVQQLIALYHKAPAIEVLLLDELTYGLDLVGLQALTFALKQSPGRLIITSHNMGFLEEIGIDKFIEMG